MTDRAVFYRFLLLFGCQNCQYSPEISGTLGLLIDDNLRLPTRDRPPSSRCVITARDRYHRSFLPRSLEKVRTGSVVCRAA